VNNIIVELLLPFIFKMENLRHTIKFYYDKDFGPCYLEKVRKLRWIYGAFIESLND
jgi:hypothetical protein